jgi:hypothetical protein
MPQNREVKGAIMLNTNYFIAKRGGGEETNFKIVSFLVVVRYM